MTRPSGSFLLCAAALAVAAGALAAGPARAQTTPPSSSPVSHGDSIVAHLRVIGVFDDETGKPVEGVEVKDVFTGFSALTTSTGTVILPLDTSGALLRLRKVGYLLRTYPVPNAADDTVPVTLTIATAVPQLPTVTTRARGVMRGPADTLARLERVGFYDRRASAAAPPAAYVTEDQLNRWAPTLMTDIGHFSGRALCTSNVYIDGVHVQVPSRVVAPGHVSRVLKTGLDALIDPAMIAGIETYTTGEVPPDFNATGDGASVLADGSSCVTMIWTR